MVEKKRSDAGFSTQVAEKDRLIVAVAYFFTWVGGLLLYLLKKDSDKAMAFHGMQALIVGIVGLLLGFVTFGLASLIAWVVCLFCAFKVFTEGDVQLPTISDYAKKYA